MNFKNLLFSGSGTPTPLGDFALLILRVGIGGMIAYHGFPKLQMPPQFVEGVGQMGFPAPIVFAWAAALAEFGGGILIALGLLTRPAAIALAFNMAVAAFVAHGPDPFFTGPGVTRAKEMAVLYLLPAFLIAVVGAGRFSVDRLLRGK